MLDKSTVLNVDLAIQARGVFMISMGTQTLHVGASIVYLGLV